MMLPNDTHPAEERIINAAVQLFLFFGYHGTTLHQIAARANVPKSSVHYYFRSKDRLYGHVIRILFEEVLHGENSPKNPDTPVIQKKWFVFTELYNNRNRFEKTLQTLYLDDWPEILSGVRDLLEV